MSVPVADVLESDDSIIELLPPYKPTPILVEVDVEEEIVLNVSNTPRKLTPEKPVTIIVRNQTPNKQHEEGTSDKTDAVSPYHWTNDMKSFYNDDWGGEENFNLDNLLSRMNSNRKFWNVAKPRMPSSNAVVCFKCNEHHKHKICRSTSCYMCGIEGHLVARCPQRMCLSCGKRGNSFVTFCHFCRKNRYKKCFRCSVYGHSVIDCTDNWRRFHNITSKSNTEIPDKPAPKPMQQIWCCNCGRQGHLEVNCSAPREDCHKPSSTLVSSYASSFNVDKASGLDYRKVIRGKSRQNPETPSAVQSQTSSSNHELKRKRYFDVPSEEINLRSNRPKYNNEFSTINPATNFGQVFHGEPSAVFNRPSPYTSGPERVDRNENNLRFNRQNDNYNNELSNGQFDVSVGQILLDRPSSSHAPERNILSVESRKPFIRPEPAFIPLESKKKKRKKPRIKKKKDNANVAIEKSIKKTLIEENKVVKKKDNRVLKYIKRRWKDQNKKRERNHLIQHPGPSIPAVPPPLLSLPFRRPPVPPINQRPAGNPKEAIKRWNNHLLGI